MFVKVCGLSTAEDVRTAVDAGADAVGFVLTESPRQVGAARVRELVELVPPGILTVAVFRAEPIPFVRDRIEEAGVNSVQLHGVPTAADFAGLRDLPVTLIRATSPKHTDELAAGALGEDLLLLDSPTPGSGQEWDVSTLPVRPEGRWMLAGGLNPGNVRKAIEVARPWGVDVSSGVEISRGVKDPRLIETFLAAVRS